MNGYTPPHPSAVFASYNSPLNGQTLPRSPERQHKAKPKSSAKAIYDQRKHFTKTSINSLTDTSQYHVEHLTTFVLDRKDGMVTIEDGIRKLRLLDAKGKVWTQDMLLQVEEKAVSLHDLETKKELENFPMATLQHCQAVMNSCSYDSILALVCKEPGQNRPDLHLFHCQDIKANLIQADIESAMLDAKGGKVKRRPDALRMILKSDGVIPPPPASPAPEPPPSSVGGVDVKGRVAAWSAWASEQQDYNDQRPYAEEGVCPEMIAARVDRDVQILNHILDDIEFLVTSLQKAAEAYHQLSRRKKTKKGKKKSPGEGVLTLRSRPPGEDEFVDCLQKFKHAFNLLAKLSDHIQNPSALDLLHFLFTPLRMVIQTSSVELARSVVVPLLTRETVQFLQNSLTAEEKHVWTALSDGWTRCRSEWPEEQFFPACALRFRDGWEPPVLAFLGPSREQELSRIAQTIAQSQVQRPAQTIAQTQVQRPPDGERLQNQILQSPEGYHPSTDGYHQSADGYLPSTDGYHQSADVYHQSADGYLPSPDGYHQSADVYHQSADGYQALPSGAERGQGPEVRGQLKTFVAKSKYDFVARNNTELSVLKDELVEVVDDRKQWWKVRNGGGASGYVPNNILEVTRSANQNDVGAEPVYSHTIQQLLGELNEVKETNKQTMKTAATAMPPSTHIPMPSATHHPMPSATHHPMPSATHHHPMPSATHHHPMPSATHHHPMPSATHHPPMPPAAPMLPPPAPAPSARLPSPPLPPPVANNAPGGDPGNVTMREQRANQRHAPVNRRKSNMEEVQDELMTRLTLGRSAQKKMHHQVHSGPAARHPAPASASVTYDSAPDEVRAWLEAKGFSPVTITSLGVLTGAQLFSLNKEELKTVCPDDGARVFSQVTVQKAALEKSSGNELLDIMRRRQEKLSAVALDSGVESFDEGSAH